METKEKNLDEALESRYKLLQDLEEMTEQKRIQEEEKEATQIALEGREKSFKKAQNDLEAKLVELGIKKSDFEIESLNLLSETTQTMNNLNELQDMFEETQQQAQPLIDQISDSESGSDSEDSGNNSKIEMTEIDDGEEESTTVVEDSDDENIDNKKENADNEDDNIIKEGNVINKEDETNSVINKQSKENEEENEDEIEEEDEGKNDDEKELFLASDQEFEDKNFDVGIYTVKNYSKPDISIVKDVNVPSSIKNKLFQPSSVSIKQKVVFVAVGTGSHVHTGGRQGCDLAPGCQLSWNRSTRISKVAVLGGNHPKVGQEVWSCHHHSLASVKGYRLQMQMVKHKPRSDTKNKDGEL